MASAFVNNPILNSPFREPDRHFRLSDDGTPTEIIEPTRRTSSYVVPVPSARRGGPRQAELELEGDDEPTGRNTPNALVNEIRSHIREWRGLAASQWGVTHDTARLLQHWRDVQRDKPLFFCQVEAAETVIWLTEVAPRHKVWETVRTANEEANPDLLRLAMKMATGSGKTTVMAMLIAWHTINKARRRNSRTFSDCFLIVTPGITIKDRLRVLLPSDPENYYETRNIVPADMLDDVRKAQIVITNYHGFKRRETIEAPKLTKAILAGRSEEFSTIESEGEMIARVCRELMGRRGIIVINDEAHHCYRHKVRGEEEKEERLGADEKAEAKRNEEAARVWISGLEAVRRKLGIGAVYDLSATPFFLRGSGYAEGTLFPWVVSDFSLIDAIESGIVKVPRVPVSDNQVGGLLPQYRDLWRHIGKKLPRKNRTNQGEMDPDDLPPPLLGALHALYEHYEKVFEKWQAAGQGTPPVFIIVCINTSVSKLVYDYVAGYERQEGERTVLIPGKHALFRNVEDGRWLHRPRTLLIDSEQLESGEALSADFKKIAAAEIDEFKHELRVRFPGIDAEKISDETLLREAMNTVGKPGKLGEHIRCVVSVSMLTEGWDANTVTHILGVRAFGTQLLCEQVVGRALRRVSYEPDKDGLFEAEYADILGVPFTFAAGPEIAAPKPPRPTTRVFAVEDRAEACEIRFPRVTGYRVTLPRERLVARFTANSKLEITPDDVATRTRMEPIVGEQEVLTLDKLRAKRPSEVAFAVAGHALRSRFRDDDGNLKPFLFPQLLRITQDWMRECLVCRGDTFPAFLLWRDFADMAAERIYTAVAGEAKGPEAIRPILDSYNREGSSRHVKFETSRSSLFATSPGKCHVNFVVGDSDWELHFAQELEDMPEVLAYVKNQNLFFEVPYVNEGEERRYLPDYIVRLDLGGGETLNLVAEIIGFRRRDKQAKTDTMERLWVPAINNHGRFGRWGFVELTEVDDAAKTIRAYVADQRAPVAA
jgi:type III restriction enzyme